MVTHNFKISYRHMLRSKVYSLINIGGLAMGMVVTMLIGLWVYDELSFNRYHDEHESIVQVLRQESQPTGEITTDTWLTTGMGQLIAQNFSDYVEGSVMMRGRIQNRVLSNGDHKFRQDGIFMQANGPEVIGLEMIQGTAEALNELHSIILSESLAKKLFPDGNPMNKLVKLNANQDLMVTGIYKDLPQNSRFSKSTFFTRLELSLEPKYMNTWEGYNVHIYAKLAPNTNLDHLSQLISEQSRPNLSDWGRESNQRLILHSMKDWHLKSAWDENGALTMSQELKAVWLYATIGLFVLVLACINFMNLSTARSEKRAKEVGIRKTLGSIRKQLVAQFYIESLLYCLLAYGLSLVLLSAILPWFNETAGKAIAAPWSLIAFWFITLSFVLFTAILAGSYPAIYLSSFQPIKALKGTANAGKRATLPRKVLVVFQFTISIALIVGTITVNKQIQMAKERPVGYSPKGMLSIKPASPNFRKNRALLKQELMATGYVTAVGTSDYPVVNLHGWNHGFSWEGMDPNFDNSFNTINVSHDYAEAVDMKFIMGRDFSDEFESDKNAIIINQSAMEAMKLENPIGTMVRYAPGWTEARNYTIIGVVADMIKGSPFESTSLSVIFNEQFLPSYMYIRLKPEVAADVAIPALEEVFSEILPEAPFDYTFADDDYNFKFDAEIRLGELASFFSTLAILISSLGLFGLASYVAEQRTKEIGIRKVLGATVMNLWQLLSKDFVLLVLISCLVAIPVAYAVLDSWLATYELSTGLHWWIFGVAGAAVLVFTLATVSYQALKAATANPVKSLRME